MSLDILFVWLQFGICAAVIGYAGTRLSRYGDVIGDKTGLSGSWIGMVLLATVTSLPELVTGITSVTVADLPEIAVSNVFGSCMINLAMLVVVDFLYRQESFYRRASQGHILSAAFGIVLIGFAGINILLGDRSVLPAIAQVSVATPLLLLLYAVAMRMVLTYEREHVRDYTEEMADRYPDVTLREAGVRYALAATAVVAAGILLPFAGERLAETMGWNGSFVGTLFIAGATTLPELAVTISALRIGALDMAIANLLGSNLFNAAILAVDDVFFRAGPLFSHVSTIHALSALSAVTMAGIAVIGLLYRPGGRILRTVGWASVALFAIYLLNAYVIFRYGD